jgi:hypothetical protein
LAALRKSFEVRLKLDMMSVPPAQIPFAQQQLSKQRVLVNRVAARQEIFDPRLLAGKPGRFERVTDRVHARGRRRWSSLVAGE